MLTKIKFNILKKNINGKQAEKKIRKIKRNKK